LTEAELMQKKQTVEQQFDIYFEGLRNRKRRPVKPATLNAYSSYWRNWVRPEIGAREISTIENGTMRQIVSTLSAAALAPATIGSIINLIKEIVGSAVDENGNELYPRKWNSEFIDSPVVSSKDQDAPTITRESLQEALRGASAKIAPLYALLAGSGLRIAECLGLQVGVDDGKGSFWIPTESKVIIRDQLYRGRHQAPKSAAGVREVDLAPELNDYLCRMAPNCGRISDGYLFQSSTGKSLRPGDAYAAAKKDGIPGFHSLRRFRRTHLENQGVPAGMARFWMGHASADVDDRYVRLENEIKARKEWAQKAGLGFDLNF
jgi:integrase